MPWLTSVSRIIDGPLCSTCFMSTSFRVIACDQRATGHAMFRLTCQIRRPPGWQGARRSSAAAARGALAAATARLASRGGMGLQRCRRKNAKCAVWLHPSGLAGHGFDAEKPALVRSAIATPTRSTALRNGTVVLPSSLRPSSTYSAPRTKVGGCFGRRRERVDQLAVRSPARFGARGDQRGTGTTAGVAEVGHQLTVAGARRAPA